MTEYIIIVALVAIAAIGVFSFFGQTVRGQMDSISRQLAGFAGNTGIRNAQTAATETIAQSDTTYGLENYNKGSLAAGQ